MVPFQDCVRKICDSGHWVTHQLLQAEIQKRLDGRRSAGMLSWVAVWPLNQCRDAA
jgi:hypothetical protein